MDLYFQIYLELESQIRKFQVLNNGQLPYYVDGHQHVHVFPGTLTS